MLVVFMDLAMPYGIDIPQVIRKGLRRSGYVPLAKADGLHTSQTKVSQVSYIDGEVVFGMLCGSI
jgi:hypothetical protein